MPIACITDPAKLSRKEKLPGNIDFAVIFETDGKLGQRIHKQRSISVVSLNRRGERLFAKIPEPTKIKAPVSWLNYLVWRKFLLDIHYRNIVPGGGYTRRRGDFRFEREHVRHFVLKNRDRRRAVTAIQKGDADIHSRIVDLLRRDDPLYEYHTEGIEALLNISETLWNAYCRFLGFDPIAASVLRSRSDYLTINLALQYGLTEGDFDDRDLPTRELLKIFCRLFVESVVHGREKESLERRYATLIRAKEMLENRTITLEGLLS